MDEYPGQKHAKWKGFKANISFRGFIDFEALKSDGDKTKEREKNKIIYKNPNNIVENVGIIIIKNIW